VLTVSSNAVEEEKLSEDIDQMFELTRIIVLVLAGLIPNLTEDKARGNSPVHWSGRLEN
jgi:hypothetical protein